MGVKARVIVYAPSEERAVTAARAGFARMDALEDVLSDYRKSSEIMRLCASTEGKPRPVSADLADALDAAFAHARRSDGAFDPTVGPVVKLWRAARKAGRLPSAAALDEARRHVGWRRLGWDPVAREVTIPPGVALDFGGIGKGLAADACVAVLRDHGLESCLVDLGGDITTGAPPPGRAGWSVLVGDGPIALSLTRAAVATSADSEQHLEADGVRYSHIVDPRTGLGVTHRASVTVIAPDGATADALASAISVLGDEGGLAYARTWAGVEASVTTVRAGRPETRTTAGFARHLLAEPQQ